MKSIKLIEHYQNLLEEFGDPVVYWPQWCAKENNIIEREKIIIGMILVQRTTWHNANISLKRLRDFNLLSISKISSLNNLTELTEIIRPAGFFQSKPQRLFDICKFVSESGGVAKLMERDTDILREELLNLKGVGPETADTILLYAFDKPQFIIDEYTYRWVEKLQIPHKRDYLSLQKYFHDNLKPNVDIYRNLHALIIISQRGEKAKMEIV